MDDTQQPAAAADQHPIRDETGRQLVVLAAGLLFVGLASWLERWMSNPDAARTVKMHALHDAEVAFARVAASAWRWAERARVAYQREVS